MHFGREGIAQGMIELCVLHHLPRHARNVPRHALFHRFPSRDEDRGLYRRPVRLSTGAATGTMVGDDGLEPPTFSV